jgi:uncharacterized protein YecT (DUF1311 family)
MELPMRKNNVACLVLPACAIFLTAETAASAPCGQNSTQQELNVCSLEAYEKADRELNALYKQQIARLGESGKTRLKDAQRAWVVFRDKACLYEVGPREESGTIWPLLQNSCLEKFTKQRVADLKEYVECVQDGCP